MREIEVRIVALLPKAPGAKNSDAPLGWDRKGILYASNVRVAITRAMAWVNDRAIDYAIHAKDKGEHVHKFEEHPVTSQDFGYFPIFTAERDHEVPTGARGFDATYALDNLTRVIYYTATESKCRCGRKLRWKIKGQNESRTQSLLRQRVERGPIYFLTCRRRDRSEFAATVIGSDEACAECGGHESALSSSHQVAPTPCSKLHAAHRTFTPETQPMNPLPPMPDVVEKVLAPR